MFEFYEDTIIIDGAVVDEQYLTRVAGHLDAGTSPVRIVGAPGSGKVHALRCAVRDAGYRMVEVDASTLRPYDVRFIRFAEDLGDDTGRCVLVVSDAQWLSRDDEDTEMVVEALRMLAEHRSVAATFVVETTVPALVGG